MYLSCGDSLIDFFATSPVASDVLRRSTENFGLQLNGHVGGSPLNVACGLSALGNSVRYLGKLSSDPFGEHIKAFLHAHQVDSSLCPVSDVNTTLAVIQRNSDGSANYAFYARETADLSLTIDELPLPLSESVRFLHVGSYATVAGSTADALASLVEQTASSCVISYDPNIRTGIEPDLDRWRACVTRFSAAADMIKVSDEDIAALYGAGDVAIENFVADAMTSGVGFVVVTRGQMGVTGFLNSGQHLHQPAEPVDVIDTVGAGDSFQAALLHWLGEHHCVNRSKLDISTIDLAACLSFARRAAAFTCMHQGAVMPKLADL